jgi:hypothetical protein
MKRTLTMIALLLVTIVASAQTENDTTKKSKNPVVEKITLDRTFNISDNAVLFTKTTRVDKSSFGLYEWNLKNDRIGETNIIVFDIKNKITGRIAAHQSWSENTHVLMEIFANGEKAYCVEDDMFIHLMIIPVEGTYSIIMTSELKKK